MLVSLAIHKEKGEALIQATACDNTRKAGDQIVKWYTEGLKYERESAWKTKRTEPKWLRIPAQ